MRSAVEWLDAAYAEAALQIEECFVAPAPPHETLAGLIPPLTVAARLWGRLDPSRAAGAAARLAWEPLRAVCRAGAMQTATWPLPLVRRVLRRAERDLELARSTEQEAGALIDDAWLELAAAWARHAPAELPRLQARWRGLGDPTAPAGLLAARARELLAQAQVLPAAHDLTAGDPNVWRRQIHWSLSPGQRLRAYVALALESKKGSGAFS